MMLKTADAFRQAFKDPLIVHVAMLRGEIAKPALRDMLHAYGGDVLARWDRLEPKWPQKCGLNGSDIGRAYSNGWDECLADCQRAFSKVIPE